MASRRRPHPLSSSTPLVPGKQTLTVSILPTVVVEGEVVPGLLNINRPIAVTVDVDLGQRDFDEVLKAAAMKTGFTGEMGVGQQYVVSASTSLAGHADTVSADIHLGPAKNSAAVTIVEVSAAPAARQLEMAASVRRASLDRGP